MSKLYIITNTVGEDQFTIQPGALNGPGGTQRDTDLRLYGQGATNYGEGVNENLYRILESFACPEKAGSPGIPQTENDIGIPGAGINNPVPGQLWFNTSTNRLLVYSDGTGGFGSVGSAEVSGTEPSAPVQGDLWYDTGVPQLKVYNGTIFISVADRYLLHDGSAAMTGNLDMDSTYRIINVVDPVGAQDAATMNYVDTELAGALSGTVETTYLRLDGTNGPMTGDVTFGTTTQIFLNDGAVGNPTIAFTGDPDSGMYYSGGVAFATAGVLRLQIEVNGTLNVAGTTNYETLVTGDDDIPNKKYVDDLVSSGTVIPSNVPEIHTSLGAAKAGDIGIVAGEIFIYNGSAWRQIYPAVYT